MIRSFTKHDNADTGTVLIVTPGGLEHGGGIGRQMGYFLRANQDSGQKLRYQIVDSRGPWYLGASSMHIAGAVIYFTRAALTLLRARLFSSPCVAHVNITGRGSTIRKIILLTIARALGLRYALHLHDYDYAEYYRSQGTFLKRLIAMMFRSAAAVVVLGQRDLEVVSQSLQLRRDRMIVLHNAVPDPLPNLNRTCPGRPCHLLFLGYLSARKGVPDLLRALASPTMKLCHWRATLAGGGAIDKFRKLADDLGILDRLCFPGWLDQVGVSALCTDADVLVLPSHAEGLAMSVLEGLSHGLAVVTTPVGAHSEVIEPDVSGILVPPGEVAALADALVSVIEDETLRERLARGARARFLAGFDVRRYAARLGQLHAGLFELQHNQPEAVGKGQLS
jgi:glycosyltransferase involved in cell wall biosynthesis